MPPQMLAVRQRLAPGYNADVGVNANWRWLGCAIALLVAGGCEQLFQVEGADRRDAAAVGSDSLHVIDVAPDTHDEDGDGVFDPDDNCPSDVNPGVGGLQVDTDGDRIGDPCDPSMATQQMRQFFDPLITLDPGEWTTTGPATSTWIAAGDAMMSGSTPAFADRPISTPGTAEVWVSDLDVHTTAGRVWGVLYPMDLSNIPEAGSAAGCVLSRNPDGTDDVYVSTGFTSIDAGPLVGSTNTGPIRIVASLDLASMTITCTVSRPPSAPTSSSEQFANAGSHLTLFASDPGPTFNSVFYMTSP